MLTTMNLPQLVVFGEALTDFIREADGRWRSVAGGSCWNVARVCARLGAPTGFAGTVSRDVFGDELTALSRQAGLDMRFMRQVARPPLLAMVPSAHPPQYFFIGENSADLAFDTGVLPDGWIEAAQIVHFGSLSLARQPLAAHLLETATAVHAAGKRIAFDPNYRDAMAGPDYRPTLRRMAGLASYIKVSDEDLRGLFPELDETSALAQLRAWAPTAAILMTRGAAGMTLITAEGTLFQPALPTLVADTVGAGDASMGGWLASLLTRPEAMPASHLEFSAASAAAVCARQGAYAPTREEIVSALAVSR
ncbi:carbohydrate kinase [Ralstonia pseudosolanacearum]|uniref:carbohydrate kinase family protein n=1 Tax=Ralstonia pseudosolanacearum TaxID=1310165 RepID=UPI002675FF64|nr:carbohydrate kinase [Ralstonia pseudosolanacearum]MDO3507711.1 carbohydrate kinase [Ralstonia pseudosolanacearum]MDO3512233.1 carbohydrate kinase [Ralstonia pseudosolanacearum]MDO3537012.1 carbohydrate kinase [Ralstonia pseudosolanacearum]MDO3606846.1 carbohydrate kinase [Ralstonia pseudosolanacearum]MDO3610909.1 carbohydrate kinase [Ralstonia pseudosolanacearum]